MPGYIFMQYSFKTSQFEGLVKQRDMLKQVAYDINEKYGNDVFSFAWSWTSERCFYTLMHGVDENLKPLKEAALEYIINAGSPSKTEGSDEVTSHLKDYISKNSL